MALSGICPRGAYFFPGGGAQHALGPENHLKSLGFTGSVEVVVVKFNDLDEK